MKLDNWRKYGFEFLSIFFAVILAFALNNWNDHRRDDEAANKILAEISNGLSKDIEDISENKLGHKMGILSCEYWRDAINGKEINQDHVINHYFSLTRDYISIQNISGYESLKSKGLELIEDDSLRFEIITLYEYDYSILKKFEEEYNEMQYHENYFEAFNEVIAPNLKYDEEGAIVGIKLPLDIDEKEKNILLSYLWKIHFNRKFLLDYYEKTEEKLIALHKRVDNYLQ
jgi:hypothetical protein